MPSADFLSVRARCFDKASGFDEPTIKVGQLSGTSAAKQRIASRDKPVPNTRTAFSANSADTVTCLPFPTRTRFIAVS